MNSITNYLLIPAVVLIVISIFFQIRSYSYLKKIFRGTTEEKISNLLISRLNLQNGTLSILASCIILLVIILISK
jgi:hypothetical protein